MTGFYNHFQKKQSRRPILFWQRTRTIGRTPRPLSCFTLFPKKEAIRSGCDSGLHPPRFTNRALSTSGDKSVHKTLEGSAQIAFSSVSSIAKPARRKINLAIRQNGFHYSRYCDQNDAIWQNNNNFSATSRAIVHHSPFSTANLSIFSLAHRQTSFTFLKDVLRENFDRALLLVALTN